MKLSGRFHRFLTRVTKISRLILVGLILTTIIIVNISARGCPKRNRDRVGSGNEIFRLTTPSNLTATAVSPYQINLSWQDNSTMPPEDGFEIWRSLDSANWGITPIATTIANMTSYSDTGLIRTTTYYYRIRAFNSIGDVSEWSNVASALTLRPVMSPVAGGISHSIFRTTEDVIYTWGLNSAGQLGLGDSNNRIAPVLVASDYAWNIFNNISAIEAGGYHSIILKRDGAIWAWGQNDYGQLGLGDTLSANAPFPLWGNDSDWSMIASGYAHNLGLKSNGTLWSWGFNTSGQLGQGDTGMIDEGEVGVVRRMTPTQIGTGSDWLVIGCGGSHSFGLKINNTLWVWGGNLNGQLGLGSSGIARSTPTQVGTMSDWLAVTGGENHSLGLKSNGVPDSQAGMLWAWGSNNYGQLGDGTITDRYIPRQIGTDSNWFAFAGGNSHSLGGKVNGTIWSWGNNNYGQLGLGDSTPATVTFPTQVGIDSDWVAFACGNFHSLGLKTNGSFWAWGNNASGQLGLSDSQNRNSPTQIRFLPNPPGLLIAMAITSTQIDLFWSDLAFNEAGFKIERKSGRNGAYAQIATVGSNNVSYSDINPTGFTPATYYYYRVRAYNAIGDGAYSNEACATISGKWSNIADGFYHMIGLKTDRILWGMGLNNSGQLGIGDTINRTTPSQIGNNTTWSMISAHGAQTLAIKTDNTIWSWGLNEFGQLGLGDSTINRNTPTQIVSTSDWSTVSAGYGHTIALKNNGTIWSWGKNNTGQLGLGYGSSVITITTPAQIGNDTDWSKVSASGFLDSSHTVAIKNNGTIWSWGDNTYGQLGVSDTISRTSPTRIGADTDWSIVTTYGWYNLAIKNNGTIWSWGYNSRGQLGLGDTINRNTPTQIGSLSDWFVVAAGWAHALAIKTDNTLWCWGFNNYGQLGLGLGFGAISINTPTQIGTVSDWLALGGGYGYSFGLKTNGILWGWGENDKGQLGLGDTINRDVPILVEE